MMDLRKVKKLIELLEDSALTEMEITEGENTIRLSRATVRQTALAPEQVAPTVQTTVPSSAIPPAVDAAQPAATTDAPIAGKVVPSPLVGTFYDSPSPDDKPYVSVGSVVGEGDTLCVIEAMKTFNQLEAEIAGVVTVIYKSNGDPVEYGEPLFVIEATKPND